MPPQERDRPLERAAHGGALAGRQGATSARTDRWNGRRSSGCSTAATPHTRLDAATVTRPAAATGQGRWRSRPATERPEHSCAQPRRRSSISPSARMRAPSLVLLVVVAAELPAGLLQHSADRSRRGALRAGHQADDRERRLHRHPLPGRGPLQEAGRHLLAAGGGREDGEALGLPQRASTTIWLYRIPSLLGAHRRGAADLLGGARLRVAPRRLARRLDDGELRAARRRGALAKTDAMLLLTVVAAMGALARAYLPEQRRRSSTPADAWALAGDLLDRARGRHAAEGPADPDGRRSRRRRAGRSVDRSARWLLALGRCPASPGLRSWCCPGSSPSSAARGESFFAESVGAGSAQQGVQRPGIPRRAARLLSRCCSGSRSGRARRWRRLAAPAVWAARREPGDQVPAGLARAVLDRVRAGGDQAAALRAAALSGDRDPDRRRASMRGALAQAAGWCGERSGGSCCRWYRALAGIVALAVDRPAVRAAGLAVDRRPPRSWACWPGGSTRSTAPSIRCCAASAAAILTAIAHVRLVAARAHASCFRARRSPAFCATAAVREPVAAAAGYHEPSLVFLAGTATRLTDGAGAAEFLRGGECRFAFVEARQETSFAQRAEAIGLRYTARATHRGDQYQHGTADHHRGLSLRRPRHERQRWASSRRPAERTLAATAMAARQCGAVLRAACAPAAQHGDAGLARAALPRRWRGWRRSASSRPRCSLLDAAAIGAGAGACRSWLVAAFDRDHRFRQVGLVPGADRACACSPSPRSLRPRCRRCRGSCSRQSRCGLDFCSSAIALPGLFVTIVKRLIGRARPLVERQRRSVPLPAVRLARRICEPAVRPRHRRLRRARSRSARSGRGCGRCMWIYALLIAVSRVVLTAHFRAT